MTFSTLYLFRTLPVGVVSKNIIGHCRMLESRPWWRRREANQHPIANEMAAANENTAASNRDGNQNMEVVNSPLIAIDTYKSSQGQREQRGGDEAAAAVHITECYRSAGFIILILLHFYLDLGLVLLIWYGWRVSVSAVAEDSIMS